MNAAAETEPATEGKAEEIITAKSVDVQPIRQNLSLLLQLAENLVIATNEDLEVADGILLRLANGEAAAKEALRPMRESTTKAWQAGTELERQVVGPYTAAKQALGQRRGEAWNRLDREAKEKARLAEEEQRRREEDKRLEDAKGAEESASTETAKAQSAKEKANALRAEGRDAEADEMLDVAAESEDKAKEEEAKAESALTTPIIVHIPAASFGPRKTAGVSGRETWKMKTVDLLVLVKAAAENPDAYLGYLMANESAINSTAKGLKGETKLPGVTVAPEYGTAVRKG